VREVRVDNMASYCIKQYQEGFEEEQAQLDLLVSKKWIMPDFTPIDQLTKYYSELELDPELRLYCFQEEKMTGFVTIRLIDEENKHATVDFPIVLHNHHEAIMLLHEAALQALRKRDIRTIYSTFGLWGGSKDWAQRMGYERVDEVGVLYGIDVNSVTYTGDMQDVKPFNPEEDLDDCVNMFVSEFGVPREEVRDFALSLYRDQHTLAYYVLREKDVIVATGALKRNPNLPSMGLLSAVYDLGNRFLERLMKKLIITAKKNGINQILMFFTHLSPGDPIIENYISLGFKHLGTNVNYVKQI
jgi:hypothetical protein